MRLQKFLASCGVASRRRSEDLIAAGRVSVNGAVVTVPGTVIDEEKDMVKVDGKTICPEKKVYYLLNKPEGYVCTVEDPHAEHPVTELLPKGKRLYPVGRLDQDTEGLIILTNDGELTFKLTHPGFEFEKTYLATLRGRITDQAIENLGKGVTIDNNGTPYKTCPAEVEKVRQKTGSSVIKMTIREGKNRQIRKMCDGVGYPVMHLKRIALGRIQDPLLKVGNWRMLTDEEIEYLKGC